MSISRRGLFRVALGAALAVSVAPITAEEAMTLAFQPGPDLPDDLEVTFGPPDGSEVDGKFVGPLRVSRIDWPNGSYVDFGSGEMRICG